MATSTENKILEDYTQEERLAYLKAIANIATADREASAEEVEFLQLLSETADLTESETQEVIKDAKDPASRGLREQLDVLRESDLRFALMTDMISFAKADKKYTKDEEQAIKQISDYLHITDEQYSLLTQFVNEADEGANFQRPTMASNSLVGGNSVTIEGNSLGGMRDMLERAGIPTNALVKGVLGVLAPIIISRVLNGRGRSSTSYNSPAGGVLGQILGGATGGFGTQSRAGDGLGSLIGILNGSRSRSSMGGLGGLLGGIFGRR